MEYAGSYALFNYRLADPALGMESSNLRLIRAFEYGLDPASCWSTSIWSRYVLSENFISPPPALFRVCVHTFGYTPRVEQLPG